MKESSKLVTEVVREGYIFTEGLTDSYAFLRDVTVPISHILRANPDNPLRLVHTKAGVEIFPKKLFTSRKPWELGTNRYPEYYDLSSFMITPFGVNEDYWKSLELDTGFLSYLEEGMPPFPQDVQSIHREASFLDLFDCLQNWINGQGHSMVGRSKLDYILWRKFDF